MAVSALALLSHFSWSGIEWLWISLSVDGEGACQSATQCHPKLLKSLQTFSIASRHQLTKPKPRICRNTPPRPLLHSTPTISYFPRPPSPVPRPPSLTNSSPPNGKTQTNLGPIHRLRRLRSRNQLLAITRYRQENVSEEILQA